MEQKLKQHWTSLLGITFLLAAVITLFQYTVEQGWLTNEWKIAIGLLAGGGLATAGAVVRGERLAMWRELVAGLGFAVLYTTVSFAGVYYAMWTPMTVFLGMLGVTAALGGIAYRFRSRMLMNVGLVGAIVSPLMLRPETDQVFSLFLYLLVVNAVFFGISIQRQWPELRSAAFVGTWLLYTVYYVHFDPAVDTVWSYPFRYAVAAFLFYVAALFVSSWRNGLKFEGSNLYLGLANAVLFGLWSMEALEGVVEAAYPLLGMGVVYGLLCGAVYRMSGRQWTAPVLTKLSGSVLLLLIGATQLGRTLEGRVLVDVYMWELVAMLLLAAGMWKAKSALKAAGLCVWLGVGVHWFFTTWTAPIGEWFGTFIPLFNWGAFAWIVLASIGFYASARVRFPELSDRENVGLSVALAILSQLMVGGLLTVQTINVFEAYAIDRWGSLSMTLTIAWGVHAALLFLWGALMRRNVFRVFGTVLLIVVALKALVIDYATFEPLYRIVMLCVLAGLSFSVTWINLKWKAE